MWNYVFYKAYLLNKEKTELNGNESYIYEKISNQDISWFPIKRFFDVLNYILEHYVWQMKKKMKK